MGKSSESTGTCTEWEITSVKLRCSHFGREAALQTGQRELIERDGYTVYDLYEQTLRDEESEAARSPGL